VIPRDLYDPVPFQMDKHLAYPMAHPARRSDDPPHLPATPPPQVLCLKHKQIRSVIDSTLYQNICNRRISPSHAQGERNGLFQSTECICYQCDYSLEGSCRLYIIAQFNYRLRCSFTKGPSSRHGQQVLTRNWTTIAEFDAKPEGFWD